MVTSLLQPQHASPFCSAFTVAFLSVSEANFFCRCFAQVLKSDGNDLTKKNHVRKPSRYLLVFNGLLKFADNLGKREVGVMTDLNTPNPSLTIGFPERGGSLRLLGTIVFPSTQ